MRALDVSVFDKNFPTLDAKGNSQAANEPPKRSGARGPRERRRKGVRGTQSPG